MIPGSDFAWKVREVESDVTRFETGDAVFGTGLDFSPCGTYSERVIAGIDQVAKLPDGVSLREGAAIGHVAVTAYQAPFGQTDIRTANSCLIHGATGGVGHILIQLAVLCGTTVYVTVGSDAAQKYVSELGATHVFRYDNPPGCLGADIRD